MQRYFDDRIPDFNRNCKRLAHYWRYDRCASLSVGFQRPAEALILASMGFERLRLIVAAGTAINDRPALIRASAITHTALTEDEWRRSGHGDRVVSFHSLLAALAC